MKVIALCQTHLRSFWKAGVLALLAMFAQTATTLLAPWPLKIVFDSVLGTHPLPTGAARLLSTLTGHASRTPMGLLTTMVVAMLIIAAARTVFTFWGAMLTAAIGQQVVYQVRLQVFDHIQRLSLSFHRRSRAGDLLARLTSDIQAIQDVVSSGLSNLITNTLSVLGILIIATVIDWHFALLMLGAAPLILLMANSYQVRIRHAARRLRAAEGAVGAVAQENLNAIQVVQAFVNEDDETRGFARQTLQSLDAGLAVSRLQAKLTPLVDMLGVTVVAAITWLGAREALAGRLTPGYLLLFITYFRSLLSPVRQLSKLSSRFGKAEASAERILEILDTHIEVRDRPGAMPAPRLSGAVAFEHVTFGYWPDRPALRDIHLRVEPGMTVALVGPTGSGKSTFLSLIPRFYDPLDGAVLVDDRDVRGFTVRSLREQISMVLQEPVLFAGTIRDNIAYGCPSASPADILHVAQAVGLDEVVSQLSHGFDTIVGERGGTLSGGQRQLITIARALLRDTPIVLLDEPMSGLDVESEALVSSGLRALMHGRTAFVSSHRLSTIENADLILVLRHGQIRECGTHQELLRAQGWYAHWRDLPTHREHQAV